MCCLPDRPVPRTVGYDSSSLFLSFTPWYSSTYSPPPRALSLSGGFPCLGALPTGVLTAAIPYWQKIRAHPTACTWVGACCHQSSVWEVASVVVGAEFRKAMAFWWVDTIAPWLSWQGFSSLPACPSVWSAAQMAMPHPCWHITPCLPTLVVVLLLTSAPQGLLLYLWWAWPWLLLALSRPHQPLLHELQAPGASLLRWGSPGPGSPPVHHARTLFCG